MITGGNSNVNNHFIPPESLSQVAQQPYTLLEFLVIIHHEKFQTHRRSSLRDMSRIACSLPWWCRWILGNNAVLSMRARRRKFGMDSFHKPPVPQPFISCWACRHVFDSLFYLGNWIGTILSMWPMRPKLVSTWMGLLSRLTGVEKGETRSEPSCVRITSIP